MKAFFICIISETCVTDEDILRTVIQEMAHELHYLSGSQGASHGRNFKKLGQLVVKKVANNMMQLPSPFCQLKPPGSTILNKIYYTK